MRKFILYLFFSLFIAQNVYANVKTGFCIGFFVGKIMSEGQSSITQAEWNWLGNNSSDIDIVNKIRNEQNSCIKVGQPYDHCLSSYSNYDAKLYTEADRGTIFYNQNRYDQSKIAAFNIACLGVPKS
jgi:hypothetical protein